MNRRAFIQSLGLVAGAVTFAGVSVSPAADLSLPLIRGDMFTRAGCYAVNPITMQATEHLQWFMVTDIAPNGIVSVIPARSGESFTRRSVERDRRAH